MSPLSSFQPIKSCPGYEANGNGDIRNRKTKRILRPRLRGRGYRAVEICGRNRYIHHLVLEAFGIEPECKGDFETHHINHIRHDNSILNLEWKVVAENRRDIRRAPKDPLPHG